MWQLLESFCVSWYCEKAHLISVYNLRKALGFCGLKEKQKEDITHKFCM